MDVILSAGRRNRLSRAVNFDWRNNETICPLRDSAADERLDQHRRCEESAVAPNALSRNARAECDGNADPAATLSSASAPRCRPGRQRSQCARQSAHAPSLPSAPAAGALPAAMVAPLVRCQRSVAAAACRSRCSAPPPQRNMWCRFRRTHVPAARRVSAPDRVPVWQRDG